MPPPIAGAAEVRDFAGRDRYDRGAGAKRDHQRAFLSGQRSAADSDRGELVDLDHRPAEQGLREHPRARAGGGDAFDVFEFDAEVGDEFSQRAGRRGDRIVGLDRYDVQAAIFEDDGVGGRTADIDANDHR